MFKPHYGECTKCGNSPRLIVVKKGWCELCNFTSKQSNKQLRASDRVGVSEQGDDRHESYDTVLGSGVDNKKEKKIFGGWKRKSPIKVVKKVTGEWKVFLEIWRERKHKCQCCPQELGDDPLPIFFSHILSKGAYVFYRLTKLNIMLMCPTCHNEWEFGDKSQEKFKLARMIADKLKRRYYARNEIRVSSGNDTPGSEEISKG